MGKGQDNPVAMYIAIVGLGLVVLFTSKSRNPILRILIGLNGSLEWFSSLRIACLT